MASVISANLFTQNPGHFFISLLFAENSYLPARLLGAFHGVILWFCLVFFSTKFVNSRRSVCGGREREGGDGSGCSRVAENSTSLCGVCVRVFRHKIQAISVDDKVLMLILVTSRSCNHK